MQTPCHGPCGVEACLCSGTHPSALRWPTTWQCHGAKGLCIQCACTCAQRHLHDSGVQHPCSSCGSQVQLRLPACLQLFSTRRWLVLLSHTGTVVGVALLQTVCHPRAAATSCAAQCVLSCLVSAWRASIHRMPCRTHVLHAQHSVTRN